MSAANWALRKYLMREICEVDIGRKPPKRSNVMQRGPARSWRYRSWVRSLPCCICGIEGPTVQAAHTGEGDHGMKQKSSDFSCIPLCAGHHMVNDDSYHALQRERFEAKHGINCKALVKRLNGLWFKYSADVK